MKLIVFLNRIRLNFPENFEKYDYSNLPENFYQYEYAPIICKKHGLLKKHKYSNHLKGQGCKKCATEIMRKKLQISQDEYFNRVKIISPNLEFITKYNGMTFDITAKCKKHDVVITLLAKSFLEGCNCPICKKEINPISSNTKLQEQFIKEANIKWNNKFDYSKTKYIHSEKEIIVTCHELDENGIEHGDFKVIANEHLRRQQCPKCSSQTKTTEQFIKDAKKIHDKLRDFLKLPRYDYSETKYIGAEEYVYIKCPIHGEFKQLANNHLKGHGCQYCSKVKNKSIAEKQILEFLKPYFLIEQSNRQIISPQELDIYIPEKQLAIEYNGLYWHSEISKLNNYHLQKTIECENKGIRLIHIFEDEWVYKQEIVKARLLNLLGKNKWSIGARKCRIKQVPVEEERIFLENNHLQGYVASTVCYGLYYFNVKNQKEYLIALMSFGPLRKNLGSSNQEGCYELYRFVTMKNFSVPGGASKLFKYFIKKFSPKQVISFADRRWSIRSEKNLYEQLGFKFDSYTEPGYFYIQGTKRINRFSLRKDILIKEYGCPPSMSEHEFCEQQGWLRIYDSGQLKYIWK